MIPHSGEEVFLFWKEGEEGITDARRVDHSGPCCALRAAEEEGEVHSHGHDQGPQVSTKFTLLSLGE